MAGYKRRTGCGGCAAGEALFAGEHVEVLHLQLRREEQPPPENEHVFSWERRRPRLHAFRPHEKIIDEL